MKSRKQEDAKTFSDLLNEALDAPTSAPKNEGLNRPLVTSLPPPYPPNNPLTTQESPFDLRIDNLGISPPRRNQVVEYSEEMDWTPTQSQSQHRAFADLPSNGAKRAFGEAPLHPESSPFWYKVPPAPINPSQRLRNPPNAPVLRSKPAEKESVFFTSKSQAQRRNNDEDNRGVTFKEASFFSSPEDTEANSLADLLNQSFSLGHETEDKAHGSRPISGWKTTSGSAADVNLRSPRAVEAIILTTLVFLWLLTASLPIPFGREMQLAILSAAGTIALRVTGDTSRDMKEEKVPNTATYVGSVLSVMELAAVCWLAWEVWKEEIDAGKYGFGVLVAMLGHQVWNTVS